MTDPTLARQIIQEPNLGTFIERIVAATKDGWEIDPMNPPTQFSWLYETHVLKPENLVEAPKPTRAEILAAARAAKAAKAAEEAQAQAQAEQPAPEAPAEAPAE